MSGLFVVDRMGNPDPIREFFDTWAAAVARENVLRVTAAASKPVAWTIPDYTGPWVAMEAAS